MRPRYEFLMHELGAGGGAIDVDPTLARLGMQGWAIAAMTTCRDDKVIVALQRAIRDDDEIDEPHAAELVETVAVPSREELEALPTLELAPPADDAPRAVTPPRLCAPSLAPQE